MSLARELLRLAEVLPAVAPGFNPFAPGVAGDFQKLNTSEILGRIRQRCGDCDPQAILLLCLQVLTVQQEELAPRLVEAEFVATLPEPGLAPARPTAQVIQEMLGRCRQEVLAVGYEISDQRIIDLLYETSRRVTDVIVICDRGKASGPSILAGWPVACPRPRVYQDRERDNAAPYASMHCKALVVDGDELLLTSANFTFHGMSGNIEFGVHLRGQPAKQAREVFRELLQAGLFEAV